MKDISSSLKNHISQSVTSLCSCWMIERLDGVTYRFTDLDRDLIIGGEAYLATDGYDRSILKSSSSTDTDEMEITGVFSDDSLSEADLRAGLFDHAAVTFFMVNWQEPEAGVIPLRRGRLGEVAWRENGFTAELRGLGDALKQSGGRIYTPECQARFCDPECGLASEDFRILEVVAAATDNQVITLTSLSDPAVNLIGGAVQFQSGANAGRAMEIANWDAPAGEVTLYLPLYHPIAVGDEIALLPGCDKAFATCRDVFANQVNFRGFPHLPGTDNLLAGV